MLQTTRTMLKSPLRLLLLGAPGVGKGTQTAKLLQHLKQLAALSSGDLLRVQMTSNQQIKDAVARGELISDDLMSSMVVRELQSRQLLDSSKSWLLDGFPRTMNQAKLLDHQLGPRSANLNCVVELNVPQDVILERIENRWVHIPSGRVYNLQYNPPKVPGRDDVTGEPLSKRDDDNVEVFRRRLETHNKTIEPLRQFYSSEGVFHTVDGETSDIIFPKLLELIKKNHS